VEKSVAYAQEKAHQPATKEPLDLIMLWDYDTEKPEQLRTVAAALAIALFQKRTPIMVSPNILYNFLHERVEGKKN
jgi:hypothetical protein